VERSSLSQIQTTQGKLKLSIRYLPHELIEIVVEPMNLRLHPQERCRAFVMKEFEYFVGAEKEIGQSVGDAFRRRERRPRRINEAILVKEIAERARFGSD
jgi:hypothetical protein